MRVYKILMQAILVLVFPMALAGCDVPSTAGEPSSSTQDLPTYHRDIAPLVAQRCQTCHQPESVAPFSMETYEEVRTFAPAALHAMESGDMPPWSPDPSCRNYSNERMILPQEIARFRAWVEAEYPEGDPQDAPQIDPKTEASEIFSPTHTGHIEAPYLPEVSLTDDYRCFPLDIQIDEEAYVTASRVVPDQLEMVHHVLIYAVPPEVSEALDAFAAAEPGPGYTCFGGTEVGVPTPIGAWVPGIDTFVLNEGMAIRLRAGSRIVMQVHYNTLTEDPRPDNTYWEVQLETTPPTALIESRPFAHRSMIIPADDPNSVQVKTFTNRTDEAWEIISVAPHMHLLGVQVRVDVIHENEESCLIDIPRWDFNWQQNYDLMPDEHIHILPGDSVRLTCSYDNSASNQAIIDGQRIEPMEVQWGDGTLDEMCLAYLTMVRPYDAAPALCSDFNKCGSTCPGGLDCLLQCMGQDTSCAMCMIPQIFTTGGCLDVACTEETDEASDCLLSCAASALGGEPDVDGCMAEQCPDKLNALKICADPVLEAGLCDAPIVSCNGLM